MGCCPPCHVMEQYANDPVESDHGRLKARMVSRTAADGPLRRQTLTDSMIYFRRRFSWSTLIFAL